MDEETLNNPEQVEPTPVTEPVATPGVDPVLPETPSEPEAPVEPAQ